MRTIRTFKSDDFREIISIRLLNSQRIVVYYICAKDGYLMQEYKYCLEPKNYVLDIQIMNNANFEITYKCNKDMVTKTYKICKNYRNCVYYNIIQNFGEYRICKITNTVYGVITRKGLIMVNGKYISAFMVNNCFYFITEENVYFANENGAMIHSLMALIGISIFKGYVYYHEESLHFVNTLISMKVTIDEQTGEYESSELAENEIFIRV